MKEPNLSEKRAGRCASPEIVALGSLIAFTLFFPSSGPAMQLQWASCAGPRPEIGLQFDRKIERLSEEIDSKTARVWRRLEQQMRDLEQRLANTPSSCGSSRLRRATMSGD